MPRRSRPAAPRRTRHELFPSTLPERAPLRGATTRRVMPDTSSAFAYPDFSPWLIHTDRQDLHAETCEGYAERPREVNILSTYALGNRPGAPTPYRSLDRLRMWMSAESAFRRTKWISLDTM